MRDLSPLDVINAHSWTSSFLTTYSLSLSYYEAVVLDALVRKNVWENVILTDLVGMRAALSEHGARQAGRAYQIEPVVVAKGCFHPKLMALLAPDEVCLLIGSGNLTVGGWGANLECLEVLHPSFAGDAFLDAADFLEGIATNPNLCHGAMGSCTDVAAKLRRWVPKGRRGDDLRLISNLQGSFSNQISEAADELGGATRLAIASPFFDSGSAVDTLCSSLGLDRVHLHAHPAGTVLGTAGSNWPEKIKSRVDAVIMEPLGGDPRHLHAKVFEIVCRKGRILVSGSANATSAAFSSGRNVELSVLRIQRSVTTGWTFVPGLRPPARTFEWDHEAKQNQVGVIKAELHGERLNGRVLTPFPVGEVQVAQVKGTGPKALGNVMIAGDGSFAMVAPSLSIQSWAIQRFVLRLTAPNGAVAEGFIALPEAGEVARRVGPIASKMFAFLGGTETPEDVSAILKWFYENPEHQPHAGQVGRGAHEVHVQKDAQANIHNLLNPLPPITPLVQGEAQLGQVAWRNLMSQVFAAFHRPRSRVASPDESGDQESGQATTTPPARLPEEVKKLENFDKLFMAMLGKNGGRRDLGLALHLFNYIVHSLAPEPSQARGYLGDLLQVLQALKQDDVPEAIRPSLAAAILIQSANLEISFRLARRRLLRLGIDLEGEAPPMAFAQDLADLLAPGFDVQTRWQEVQEVRTWQEDIARFHQTGPGPLLAADFPALSTLKDWPSLANAHEHRRASILFLATITDICPRCRRKLSGIEAQQLERDGFVPALNCCGRTMMCEEI